MLQLRVATVMIDGGAPNVLLKLGHHLLNFVLTVET
jgi:hypothetical protein